MKFTGRFEGYTAGHFKKDLLSGTIVGVVALPLAMSFAIASGVKPEYGIYTAFIAGVLISLFGGSKYQIGGPTGAFVPILLGIVLMYGYENLLVAGLMAGVLLVLMGALRLGVLIKFIPRPVTVGFTAGIAVTIFIGQIAGFLGLTGIKRHEEFLLNMKELWQHIETVNVYSVVTAFICFAVMLVTPRVFPKVPGALVGITVATLLAFLGYPGQVATIATAYGGIPSALPSFHIPAMSIESMQQLIGPAFVIAMLGGIESLLSAVVADGMTNSKHNSNRELIGQGIANIMIPFFGGIPATGAIARTATNIKSGATSPMSGIIHGVFVLLTILLLAPFASHIPLSSMAPVLMVVAWNMSERHHFMHILKMKSGDSIVLVITFLLTIFTSLTFAVEVGLLLAVLLFAKSMSEMLVVSKVLPDLGTKQGKLSSHIVSQSHDCPQISIYTVEGPLFFGAAQTFEQKIMQEIHYKPSVLILRMGNVPFMDSTGESYLTSIVNHFTGHGGTILLTGVNASLKRILDRSGLTEKIGNEHFFEHTGDAITFASQAIDLAICKGCKHVAFKECKELTKPFEAE